MPQITELSVLGLPGKVHSFTAKVRWFGVNSSHYEDHCGDDGGHYLEEALDGTDQWQHLTDHTHWFIVDLGQTYNVQKVRGRSSDIRDPTDVNIYVSNDTGDWGAAVATGISTWQDTDEWVEIDVTDKDGRYVKVEIVGTEDVDGVIRFGGTLGNHFTIFDVCVGEAIPPVGNAGIMTTNTGFWGPTF